MAAYLRMLWTVPRALARVPLLIVYLTGMYLAQLLCTPFPSYRKQARRIKFARRYYFLTAVLVFRARLRIEYCDGARAGLDPCLYVSNHISWMDILAFYRAFPIRFISKKEVASWPLFGHFAEWAGTIFLQRGRGGREVIARAAEALAETSVVLFAEGTSTEGRKVRRFLPPAFRAAIDAGVPVVPLTIHYRCHGHDPKQLGVSYSGEDTLATSAWRSVLLDRVDIHIKVHPPLDSGSMTAPELARCAHEVVSGGLEDFRRAAGELPGKPEDRG